MTLANRKQQRVGGESMGYLYDDFADNRAFNRRDRGIPTEETLSVPYQTIRPGWGATFGTPTIANSQVEVSSGDGTRLGTWCGMDAGTWEMDFQWPSSVSQGDIGLKILGRDDRGREYEAEFDAAGNFVLYDEFGSALVSSTQTVDTSTHTIKVTYDGSTFELFWDGNSVGTASDSYGYTGQEQLLMVEVQNSPDSQTNIKRVQAYPWI